MAPHPVGYAFPLCRMRICGHTAGLLFLRQGFDFDPVVHGRRNPLDATEVTLCGLDRDVAEEELNLLRFTAKLVYLYPQLAEPPGDQYASGVVGPSETHEFDAAKALALADMEDRS
jgi:hypothetical protein